MRFSLPRFHPSPSLRSPAPAPSARVVSAFGLPLLSFLALAAPGRAEPLRLPVTLRAEASAAWAENISRSSASADWRDTVRHDAHATASLLTPLATGVSLISDLEAGYESVPRFVQNTTYFGTARAQVRWKFGLGAFAPVVSAETSLSRREARIGAETGWLATGALRVSQRFTDSWRASLTGDWQQHYAAHPTFDVRHHRLLGSVTYDLNERWQLTYGRGSLWGDFVANASGRTWSRAFAGLISPAVAAYYPTLNWERTDSYGPGWVSYRAQGRSDFWWLELSPALGRNTSLPLRYESSYTENFLKVHYRQDLWTVSLLHRF